MDQREPKGSKYISQEQYTERFIIRFKGYLEGKLEPVLKFIEKEFHDEKENLYDKAGISQDKFKEELESRLLSEKSKIIKACLAAHQRSIDKIKKNYEKELKFKKEDKYLLRENPRWMMEDSKIVYKLERFPFTIPILNYLWNFNRNTRGPELKQMIDQTEQVAGPIKYKTDKNKLYDYATFVTNEGFYEKMSKRIKCSKNYIQKYFIAFIKIGILKKLGKVGRDGTLYSDGYYVPYGDSFRKQVFLKDSPDFRYGLRNFDPLRVQAPKENRTVSRDELVEASEMLNKTGLAEFKIEFKGMREKTLKEIFIRAFETVPPEKEDEIPSYVFDFYDYISKRYSQEN